MTAIEKNTAKLMQQKLQAKLDNLFAEQQAMNGNKGGNTFKRGGLVHANNGWYEDPTEFFNGRPGTYNSKTMPYMTGDANVYGQRTVKPGTTAGYPVALPNVDVTGQGYAQPGTTAANPYQLGNVNVQANRTAIPGTTSGNPYQLGDVNVQANRTPPQYGVMGNNPYKINFGIPPITYTGTNANNPYQLGDVNVSATKSESPNDWYNGNHQFNSWENQPNPQAPYRSFSGGQGQPNIRKEQYTGTPDFSTPEQAGFSNDQTRVQAANGVTQGGITGKATGLVDPRIAAVAGKPTWGGNIGGMNQHLQDITSNFELGPNKTTLGTANPVNNTLAGKPNVQTTPTPTNWGKVGTFAGQVAPMLYNMFKGLQKPDKVKPMYNPYEGQIRSAMANRRFNIDPLLNANMVANAVGNRNIRNAANSRGEMMGNYGASQNQRMAGDAAAWAQKSNMDNQYLGEQAQMDANLGANRAQMDWMAQDYNLKNKTATNQFLGQGFNDLGQFAQMQQLMGNQTNNDAMLANILRSVYGPGSPTKFYGGYQDVLNALPKTKE